MNANDNNSREPQAEVIELGVASVETQGPDVGAEDFGMPIEQGITSE